VAQGRDGATMAELRLRKNRSGERGPGKPERGGHTERCPKQLTARRSLPGQSMGHGATVITERAAADGERWQSSLFTRAERERGRGGLAEGASERGELGE
jgi:hypothetical protein